MTTKSKQYSFIDTACVQKIIKKSRGTIFKISGYFYSEEGKMRRIRIKRH